ncbi:MAG: type II toxin-antitoxin system RelE/ParE family toxin [Spirochaetaceae bacterium]|nr:MAG: type II toxin-antitoxin system RelE/ParE family toxin [Spirochaetaceae bacterium]
MKIRWSEDAADDLAQIIGFIAERSGKKMAREVYYRIRERVVSVKEFPAAGRVVPELSAIGISDIHELIEPPWRVFYRAHQSELRVLSVIDGRRNAEEILYRKVISGKIR